MRRSLYGRRRRWRTGTFVLFVLLTALLLVSCVAGSNVLWVKGFMGWDVEEYIAEPTVDKLAIDGKIADDLVGAVKILLSNSVRLQEFRGTREAVEYYRDAILNDMLRNHYTKYTGKRADLDEVAKVAPYLSLSTLISAKDFENTVYRYFGGTDVTHSSGRAFSYLKSVNYYTSPIQASDCDVTVSVTDLEESENTYRMQFTLRDDRSASASYTALFVKRTDGTAYWKSLTLKGVSLPL